jgi:4-hydroxybenzoate polyprenyltransferase
VLFGARSHDLTAIEAMGFAFVAFCFMSSCVYVINDYVDRVADQAHPTKHDRPLASGQITTAQAVATAVACAAVAATTAWFAAPRVLLIILLYLAITSAYSLRLKHLPVVDVFCIASGYMLRILAGTWGIGIPPSGWLVLTGMFLALFLGFGKRRAEWMDSARAHVRRSVLAVYPPELLDTFLAITVSGTVMSYGLYTIDTRTVELHHTDKLIYTLPLVLFGLFRYLFLLHSENKGENPSVDVFSDYQIVMCGLAFAAVTLWLLSH